MNRLACLLAALVLAPVLAWADPPGRVGRLSLVEGEASVFVDPDQGWESARINTHLTSENSLWTEPRSRAEVRIGSTAIRLEEATQLDIVRLDDFAFQAHVVRGSLAIRIGNFERGESFVVTTPDASFQLRGNGRYRIDADPDRRESRLTVLSGNARLEAAGATISVDTGRSVRVAGGERSSYEFEQAWSSPIDEWALARDERFVERESARYVSPNMTGWEDLDEYGAWRNEPEYGAVWYPTRVDPGWAPYRYGRWDWVRPWGWAWVDDAPWGYAPFHYGRWVSIGNRWGWYPGRYVGRPIWAPALVGWIGGPGWSVSISSRPTAVVGWYPLSPYDRYQPWYNANVTYVNNVNNVVIVNRGPGDRRDHRYDNRDRGATVVPRENLFSRRPVQNVRTPIAREVIAAQPVVPGTAVLPSGNEWRGRPRPVEAPRVPAGVDSVTRRPAAPPAVPGAQPGRPAVSAPAAPHYPVTPTPPRIVRPAPSAPSAPSAVAKPVEPATQSQAPNAFARPAPAEPVTRVKPAEPVTRVKPAEPVTRVKPAEPVTRVKPAAPAAQQSSPNAFARPAPAEPVTRVKPAEPVTRTKPPEAQGGAAPAPRAVERATPVEKPGGKPATVQEKPVAKPAPVQEKPARGNDPPARVNEKGPKTAEP